MPARPSDGLHRVSVRLDDDDYQRLMYWAKRRDESVSDYLRDAIDTMVALENHDFDIPSAMDQRMNQLVETTAALSSEVHELQRIAVSGFESLINVTNGDNYLSDLDEGILAGEDGD